MASPQAEEPAFSAGDAADKSIKIDPNSAEVAASLELKELKEAAEKEREDKKVKETVEMLKKSVFVSGILAAVVSAVFTIVKKIKEKQSVE